MARFIVIYCILLTLYGEIYADVDDVLLKILGGSYAKIDYHPYMGCLMFKNNPRCGATLIAPNMLLTAAHCVKETTPCGLTVRLGSTYNTFGGNVYQVMKTIPHPLYNTTTKEHDIAVLELDRAVHSDIARSVAVADYRTNLPPGALCTIMGWGIVQVGDRTGSPVLKTTQVPLVSMQACSDAYSLVNRKITKNMLCAGDLTHGGRDTCQGDSGGPLICGHKLAGVVSFGRGCANPKFPGVYVDVRRYIRFIYMCFGIDVS